ncbi:Exocyst complex component SEC3A [Sesamum angolense]|uniref:Exocyst complex component SEC3A n=1 Tax=Sesamum angolense TaxID=2727404 RepID=A0AAE2BMB0_9LAMI|nr:Exocyst complex component SEC3A [Sesamum angolense]
MARSSADDEQLRRACEMAIEDETVVMSIRVVKSGGIWGKPGKLGLRHMAKPRVLAISTKVKGKRTKAFLRVLKYSNGGYLEGFDNLRSQSVAPPQWTMRNVDDRNRLVLCILNISKDCMVNIPKVVGIDVVEMALWAKQNTQAIPKQQGDLPEGMIPAGFTDDLNLTVERDLVSQAEEADMEALLGTYVMGIGEAEAFSERLKRELQALEAANVHAILENEPLIREIETGNNKLEMQSVNNKSLIEELDKLIEKLHIPAEVREKRAELQMLENTFVQRASEFLRNYFVSVVDFMLSDKNYFSQSLDKNCLAPLRKAYCSSLNLLLRRESSFFALFMCFEVPSLQPGGFADSNQSAADDYKKMGIMEIHDNDKDGNRTADLGALNESLHDLLDGIQEDFYSVVDWAHKIDPLRCISMHGITERYISGQKADAAGYVRILLDDLENRISVLFGRYVDEACHQIERNDRNVRQVGVLPYIPRFATLATRMEQYIQGQSRDLVDQAYTKIVTIMFVTLDKISQADLKYADVLLLENYAAFQNSLYDLANVVPTLAKFYHQASESYDQSCTRYINTIIYYQFERLFQFARRIEDLLSVMTPEEVPFQIGVSKADLRKVVKSSLSGVDKSITAMYKKLQKNMTSEELLPSLWEKCKGEFLDKYASFVQLVVKVYPTETIPAVQEMGQLLASM